MEFQLRAWQQAVNKGFSVTRTPPAFPLALQQTPQPAPGPYHLLTHNTDSLYMEEHHDLFTMWSCTC